MRARRGPYQECAMRVFVRKPGRKRLMDVETGSKIDGIDLGTGIGRENQRRLG